MSGGSMDYIYCKLEMEIPTEKRIEEFIDEHTIPGTKELALAAINRLHEAVIIARRLEWWMSGDDGDESFMKRMEKELGYDLTKTK